MAFHQKVRKGYLDIPNLFPEHAFKQIDASGTPEMVSKEALRHVLSLVEGVYN